MLYSLQNISKGLKMRKKNGLNNNIVTISSQLCQANLSFSTVQYRIFELMLSTIDSRSDTDDTGRLKNLKLSAVDYSNKFNVPLNNAFEQLSDAVRGFEFYIRFKTSDGKARSIPFSNGAIYNPEAETIEFRFNEEVIPLICILKSRLNPHPKIIKINNKKMY